MRWRLLLQEPSTWRGLIMLLSGVTGWAFSDTETESIVSVGITVTGAVGALFLDGGHKDEP